MKKQIIYYIIITLGVLSAGWYWYAPNDQDITQKQIDIINRPIAHHQPIKNSAQQTATTTIVTPTLSSFSDIQVDMSDWQIYKSEKYGYEFKYPKGWRVLENTINSDSKFPQECALISKSISPPGSFREPVGFAVQFLGEKKSADELIKETIDQLSGPYFSISQLEYKTETTENNTELVLLEAYKKNQPVSFHVYIIRNNEMFRVIYETPDIPPVGGYGSPSILYGIAQTFSPK